MDTHISWYLLALVIAGACGSEEAGVCPASAHGFEPCGGDPRGTWEIQALCIDPEALGYLTWEEWCPGASSDVSLRVEGTIEIGDDVMHHGKTATIFSGEVRFPFECLYQMGFTSCSQVLAYALWDMDKAVCVDVAGGCDCNFIAASARPPMDSPYSMHDGSLRVNENGYIAEYPYCAAGQDMIWSLGKVVVDGAFLVYQRR